MDLKKYMDLHLFSDTDDDFNENENIDDINDDENLGKEGEENDEEIEIPEEFAGLPPEIAKEFTLKWKKQQEDKQENNETNAENKGGVEKNDEALEKKSKPQEKTLEERIKELEEENNRLKNQQQQQQIPRQKVNKPSFQPLQLNQIPVEVVRRIRQDAKKIALKSVGITAEQLEDLEFEDGGIDKKADYETAYNIAQTNILNNINRELANRYQKEQEFLNAHEANKKAFKSYEDEQKKDPNFEAIRKYAVNDFFEKQTPMDQMMIRDAYARIERGVASPTDIYAVKKYFEEAKSAYKSITKPKENKQAKVIDKYKQASKLPRADKLAGSSGAGSESSVETAIRLMKTKKWEDIPEKYQNILLDIK